MGFIRALISLITHWFSGKYEIPQGGVCVHGAKFGKCWMESCPYNRYDKETPQ
jgi:hypothetical protein